jgi:hypothetical protein
MTVPQRETLSRWVDLIFKVGTPLGFAALFYLKGTFATHESVAKVADRIANVETALTLIIEQNKTNERQDKRIDDHETRLRALERFNR